MSNRSHTSSASGYLATDNCNNVNERTSNTLLEVYAYNRCTLMFTYILQCRMIAGILARINQSIAEIESYIFYLSDYRSCYACISVMLFQFLLWKVERGVLTGTKKIIKLLRKLITFAFLFQYNCHVCILYCRKRTLLYVLHHRHNNKINKIHFFFSKKP